MLNNDQLNEIQQLLKQSEAEVSVEQLHALLSGYICGGGDANPSSWTLALCGCIIKSPLLTEFYGDIEQSLASINFEYRLLLPQDSVPIKERSKALVDWSSDFLAGLGLSGVNLSNINEPDVTEGLQDITQITQLDYNNLSDDDEHEGALFELIEFVRSVVMYLYTEIQSTALNGRTH